MRLKVESAFIEASILEDRMFVSPRSSAGFPITSLEIPLPSELPAALLSPVAEI